MISYEDETTSASSLLDDRSQFPSRYFSGEVIFLLQNLFRHSCTFFLYLPTLPYLVHQVGSFKSPCKIM